MVYKQSDQCGALLGQITSQPGQGRGGGGGEHQVHLGVEQQACLDPLDQYLLILDVHTALLNGQHLHWFNELSSVGQEQQVVLVGDDQSDLLLVLPMPGEL